jgi:hypothetical protein
VNDTGGSPEGTLAEQAQNQNAKMQVLIVVMGQLIAASRALLARLPGVGKDDSQLPPDVRS